MCLQSLATEFSFLVSSGREEAAAQLPGGVSCCSRAGQAEGAEAENPSPESSPRSRKAARTLRSYLEEEKENSNRE